MMLVGLRWLRVVLCLFGVSLFVRSLLCVGWLLVVRLGFVLMVVVRWS